MSSEGIDEGSADDARVDCKGTESRKHRKQVARSRPMFLANACAIGATLDLATMDGIEVKISAERTHRPFEV